MQCSYTKARSVSLAALQAFAPRVAPARGTRLTLRVLAMSLALLLGSAAAANERDPLRAGEEALRREEQRLRERELPAAPSVLQDRGDNTSADLPALSPQEGERCFVITEFKLLGEGADSFAWLSDAASSYRGRCLGVKALAAVVAQMNAALVGDGYVTSRVSLPPQNLASGRLELHLDLGRVEAVQAVGDWPQTWRNTVPLREGEVLNARAIEQGLEQALRLPSAALQSRIEAGAQTNGSVVVLTRSAARPWRLGATVDNSGSAATGYAMLQVAAGYDNVLGVSDMLSVFFSSNLREPNRRNRSQSWSLDYSLPFGYGLLSTNLSHSRFGMIVQGATQQFWSHGDSQTLQLRYSHNLWRSSAARMGLHLAVSRREARSFLEDIELIVQRRRTSDAEAGVNGKLVQGAAVFDATLTYREGVSWFDAQAELPTAANGGPTLRPRILTLDADMTLALAALDPRAQWSSRVHAQATRDVLLSTDQMALGGRGSVRGIAPEAQLLGERGAYWRNELSWSQAFSNAMVAPYMALDLGWVAGPSASREAPKALAGYALGLRGRAYALRYELMLGLPLKLCCKDAAARPEFYLALGADL